MPTLFLDLETYSEISLKDVGPYKYAEHESTEILLFAYAIDDGPVRVWDVTDGSKIPSDLRKALLNYATIKVAHNSNFDRTVINNSEKIARELKLPRREKYCVPIEQWEDTMVMAYTIGIRGSLELMLVDLGADYDMQKLKDGKRLVRMFCMPQKVTRNQPYKRRDAITDPKDWFKFIEYARQDVESMRWAYSRMPKLVINRSTNTGWFEMRLWHLSEDMNDLGMPVDVEMAKKAVRLVEDYTTELDKRIPELTNGEVDSHSKRDAALRWVKERGVELPSYGKEDIAEALKRDDIPDDVRELLEIRREIGRTSTTKYTALINGTSDDGRLRGGLQYYAATRTGRYGGRRFQPQNLPHPSIKDTEAAAEAILNDSVDLLYNDVVGVAVSCIRAAIKASDKHYFAVSDLSNIEGRILPWLAGETWKLEAFRKYDMGEGPDLYKVAYHKSFGVPFEDIGKSQRQIGKYQELSLGYEGGVGAFYKQAKKFGTSMLDIYNMVIEQATEEQIEKAEYIVEWLRANNKALDVLSDEEIIGVDIVKQMWRAANSKIVKLWHDLDTMVRSAIENPGKAFAIPNGKVKALCDVYDPFYLLLIRLPSGRVLCYRSPKINDQGQIKYMSVYQNKWVESDLYGGKIAENVTQAIARDVLCHNMFAIAERYNIILTVHDEVVCEVSESTLPEDALSGINKMLASIPPWADDDLPLSASGYTAKRYKKD